MPTPFRYDDTKVLFGGDGTTQQRMLNKFFQVQKARTGTYVDRERQFLLAQGVRAGGTRYDMWREYLGNTHPFTDGVPATLTSPAAQAFAGTFDPAVERMSVGASAFKA